MKNQTERPYHGSAFAKAGPPPFYRRVGRADHYEPRRGGADQVAIPLMTMTSARVSYLYDLMDAAHDAAAIHDQSRALGHAPIVDHNFRADHQAKAEWGREVERLKLIHMPDFDDLIYDFRTMAERVDARLKVRVRRQISPRPRRTQGQMPSHVWHRRARRRSDHPVVDSRTAPA